MCIAFDWPVEAECMKSRFKKENNRWELSETGQMIYGFTFHSEGGRVGADEDFILPALGLIEANAFRILANVSEQAPVRSEREALSFPPPGPKTTRGSDAAKFLLSLLLPKGANDLILPGPGRSYAYGKIETSLKGALDPAFQDAGVRKGPRHKASMEEAPMRVFGDLFTTRDATQLRELLGDSLLSILPIPGAKEMLAMEQPKGGEQKPGPMLPSFLATLLANLVGPILPKNYPAKEKAVEGLKAAGVPPASIENISTALSNVVTEAPGILGAVSDGRFKDFAKVLPVVLQPPRSAQIGTYIEANVLVALDRIIKRRGRTSGVFS